MKFTRFTMTPMELYVYALHEYADVSIGEFKNLDVCSLVRKTFRAITTISLSSILVLILAFFAHVIILTNWLWYVTGFSGSVVHVYWPAAVVFLFEFIVILGVSWNLIKTQSKKIYEAMQYRAMLKYRAMLDDDEIEEKKSSKLIDLIIEWYKSSKEKYCLKVDLSTEIGNATRKI